MSILCKQKEIDGVKVIQMMQRIRDREEKMARLQASITDRPEPTTKKKRGWLDTMAVGFIIFAVMYLVAHVIVEAVR